jgi:hypothetical protein
MMRRGAAGTGHRPAVWRAGSSQFLELLNLITNSTAEHNGSLKGSAVVMYLQKLHHISQQASSPSGDRDHAPMADARAPNLLVVHGESFEPCEQVAELRIPQ